MKTEVAWGGSFLIYETVVHHLRSGRTLAKESGTASYGGFQLSFRSLTIGQLLADEGFHPLNIKRTLSIRYGTRLPTMKASFFC